MTNASEDIKKSSRGRPKAETEPVMVRIAPDLMARIDNFRRLEKDLPTRPEAIRRLLEKSLSDSTSG